MQHPAVLQVDELMLSPPANSDDPQADDGFSLPQGQAAAQRRMVQLEDGDPVPDEMLSQLDDGTFDFRKLRHLR
jgi:hypothetical protein